MSEMSAISIKDVINSFDIDRIDILKIEFDVVFVRDILISNSEECKIFLKREISNIMAILNILTIHHLIMNKYFSFYFYILTKSISSVHYLY